MSGFDNGSLQGGVFFQAKQLGSILRGFGPPVPQAGIVGDCYIDTLAWNLYTKRSPDSGGSVDPWGHYLFNIPATYRSQLKWFSSSPPTPDLGVTGDYCLLWGGFGNYGLQPSIYGPKGATDWPENGNGPGTTIASAGAGTVIPTGLVDEGAAITYNASQPFIVTGLVDEGAGTSVVTANAGNPVLQQGLQTNPAAVSVTLNSLYTAEDENTI